MPTLLWIMLGLLLVAVFVLALVFVFDAPPSWKSARSPGPPERSPSPAARVTPPTPAPSAETSEVR